MEKKNESIYKTPLSLKQISIKNSSDKDSNSDKEIDALQIPEKEII